MLADVPSDAECARCVDASCDSSPMTGSVAVIGAGPGGLVAARWLLAQGFEPTIFEQGSGARRPVGGTAGPQRRVAGHAHQHQPHHDGLQRPRARRPTDVFPSSRDILDYLHRYAETFGLTSRIRSAPRSNSQPGRRRLGGAHGGSEERFDRVVVASGRFHSPAIPPVPGSTPSAGSAGAISTYDYRDRIPYLGKRVLVAGCAVSALEIAAELAQLGAAQRRRHPAAAALRPAEVRRGVPSDHRIFTRYGVLATETLPAAEIDRQLKEIVVEAGGSPEQYGAPAPDPSLFAAGVTLSQQYLPLVAEGRITVRPWMTSVAGTTVTFADGHAEDFDGIVFGTGFDLRLPFLSEEIRAILDLDAVHLDADRYTFHPDLPGLAFMGMWDQSGGYFVPLELQARWIAYTWGGTIPAPSETDQRPAIDAYRSRRGMPQKTRMNLAALTFARAAGVEPHLDNWPELRRALLFGPLAPSCFRLEGPDALPDAPARFAREAAPFGAITSNELTEREGGYWSLVRAAGAETTVGSECQPQPEESRRP